MSDTRPEPGRRRCLQGALAGVITGAASLAAPWAQAQNASQSLTGPAFEVSPWAGPLAALDLLDVTGKRWRASDLQGRPVLLNFWASWCPPCRAEHPTLKALSAEGVRVVGVNMMDRADDAMGFLAEAGNPFMAVAFDPKGKVRLDWGVTAPPETFILRGDGTVAFRFIGPLVGDDYEQRFRPELEKALKGE